MSISEPTGDCCDNCLGRLGNNHELVHPLSSSDEIKSEPVVAVKLDMAATTSRKRSATGVIKVEEAEFRLNGVYHFAILTLYTLAHLVGPKTCRDKFREGAIDVLRAWRHDTFKMLYLRRPWGASCLLPEDVIDSLSSKRTIRTVQDLIREGWSPTHAEKHGQDVLKVLANYDMHYSNESMAAKENEGTKHSQAKKNVLCDSAVLNAPSEGSRPSLTVSQSPSLLAQSSSSVSWSLPVPMSPIAPASQPPALVSQSPLAVQYPPGYYCYNGYYYYYPGLQPQVPLYHQQYPYPYQPSQYQNQSLLPAFEPQDNL